MTTKVEPTVEKWDREMPDWSDGYRDKEKWEESLEEFGDLHDEMCQCNMEDPDACDCDMGGLKAEMWKSVQEAKAEEADKWKARLEQSNSLLRSTFSIAERDGRQTNWEPFRRQVEKELKLQHKLRDRLNTKDDLLTSLRKEKGEA